jgi:large subunit ribosomal protein L19e
MNLGKQKKLAARALKTSPKRIKFTEQGKNDIKEVISREGVKELVSEGLIKKVPARGNSRTRANKIAAQKAKGRRSGHGSRKGTANARFNSKRKWMIKIRALRSFLRELKEAGRLDTKSFRDLYQKAKGNFFRNKKHLSLYIEQHNIVSEKKVEEAKK